MDNQETNYSRNKTMKPAFSLSLLFLALLSTVSLSVKATDDNWNQFRGFNGDGISVFSQLPVEFSETKNIRWKTPISGAGWSSPVVWENEIWLTTGSVQEKELRAVCVDLQSGKILKNIKVFDMVERELVEGYIHDSPHLNSPATPTSVVEADHVFVHFGSQGIACLKRQTGEKIWERRDLRIYQPVRQGSSPIVDSESLYVAYDGIDQQFFIALDKKTGVTRWKKNRDVNTDWAATLRERGLEPGKKGKPNDNKKSFATATLIEVDGKRQLIAPAAEATISYDPQNGKELWRVLHPGGFNVSARPLYAHGMVYVFTSGLTGHLLAIKADGRGDVTDTHVAWSTTRSTPRIPSPVIVGDLLFMVTDSGIARCLEARTGKELWKKRLSGDHWASPVYAGGRLYFSSKRGRVQVLAASREEPKVVANNRLNASFIASPAIAGTSLVLRSTTHLYCLVNGFERSASVVAAEAAAQMKDQEKEKSKIGVVGLDDETDWDEAYQAFLAKNPDVQKKIDAGGATKEDVIAWMKKNPGGKKTGQNKKQPKQEMAKGKQKAIQFPELAERLKGLVESGQLTKDQAIELYQAAVGENPAGKDAPQKKGAKTKDEAAWDAAYEKLLRNNPAIREKVESSAATKEEVIAWMKQKAAGTGQGKKETGKGKGTGKGTGKSNKSGSVNFYAIVIGRLKTKDIELGEFTFIVDHVTSMYGNRWVKQAIVGKEVKVTGVAGEFIDKLLTIQKGATLKVRSGTYVDGAEGPRLAVSQKFNVLEMTKPFQPEDYGVPPKDFRGFHGELTGSIVEVGGYELTLRVDQIVKQAKESTAKNADAILKKMVRITGFYPQHEKPFADLHVGDAIRVGVRHADPGFDEFTVTATLEKTKKK